MLGLSASGQRVLTSNGNGLTVRDIGGGTTTVALGMIVGRGSLSVAGDTVVGATYLDGGVQLARANASTGEIEVLGEIGDFIDRSYTTPDASTIVGSGSALEPGEGKTFRWTAAEGLSLGLPG